MIRSLLPFLLALLAPVLLSAAEDERPVVDDRGVPREARAREGLPTLWIAGDSTVKSHAPMRGWGQEIGVFFGPQKINVVNRAIGGRSSRTFYTEGRWQEILDQLEEGDLVLVQFGHNDGGPLDERGKFRGSVRGIGEETEQVTKPDGSVETVHSFGWYLREYARSAREKGATVVLCSPVPHKDFDRQGRFKPDWEGWRGWVEEVAEQSGVLYVDLADRIGKRYAAMEPAELDPLFADKRTHTSEAGARLNAEVLAEALDELPGDPFDPYLREPGR